MQTKEALFAEYGAYHRDPRNRLCHEIGIPLIVLALDALTRLVHAGAVNLAEVLTILLCGYYLLLAGLAGLPAVIGLVVIYTIGLFVAWPLAAAAFVAGWVLQFAGHAFEGKSPAFLTNLVHLLVGPLWVASLAVPSSTSSSSAR
jgi:uncharacterized membrane protein YGL010W